MQTTARRITALGFKTLEEESHCFLCNLHSYTDYTDYMVKNNNISNSKKNMFHTTGQHFQHRCVLISTVTVYGNGQLKHTPAR